MKLRTFTGLDKEAPCAGCGKVILARPDVKVTVDMEGWPRKRYHPSCKPGAQKEEVKAPFAPASQVAALSGSATPRSTPTPASPAPAAPVPAGPSPTTPQPQVDPSPIPHPKVETTNAPSLSDNRPWKILKVTISVGDYTSVQAGVADFGKEGESLEQLGTRLVSELTKDVKTELDVVHQVQAGKPLSLPAQGVVSTPSTPSPAQAGAPKGVVGPEMGEIRRRVTQELECDVSAIRTVKKRHAAKQWLKSHGYESFDQVLPTDLGALKELLSQFGAINVPEKLTAAWA